MFSERLSTKPANLPLLACVALLLSLVLPVQGQNAKRTRIQTARPLPPNPVLEGRVGGFQNQTQVNRFRSYQGGSQFDAIPTRPRPFVGASNPATRLGGLGGLGRGGGTGLAAGRAFGVGAGSIGNPYYNMVNPIGQYDQYYGGFGRRMEKEPTAEMAMRRSMSMFAAYGYSAPIARAQQTIQGMPITGRFRTSSANQQDVSPLRKALSRVPVLRPKTDAADSAETQLPDLPESTTTLAERLADGMKPLGQKKLVEAWGWFRDGAYRRALRCFEMARVIHPGQSSSMIGEVYCHMSLGSYQTAAIITNHIAQRSINPFIYRLDVTKQYTNREDMQQASTLAQRLTLEPEAGADIRALNALVTWYLGDRDSAIALARSLAIDHPTSVYAGWHELMRSARRAFTKAEQAGEEQPAATSNR